MSNLKIGQMSVREFYDRLKSVPGVRNSRLVDQNHEVLRFMQRGVFGMLWSRATHGLEPKKTRTYGSKQLVELSFFADNKLTKKDYIAQVKQRPVVGFLRAQESFQDDMRFIVLTDGKDLYLVMSNEALDAKYSTLWKHVDGTVFEPVTITLLDFVMTKEFLIDDYVEPVVKKAI